MTERKTMHIIGIDIGTTSICGVAVDTESGTVLRSHTEASNAFIRTEREWEKIQSVEKIISTAKGILDSLITEETVAIGVTGQMHGILYFDKNGQAVSPLYTWQDRRSALPYGESTYAEHLGARVGYGCATDFYNRENGLVPKDAVGFCTIYDYLVMQLSERKSPLMHVTSAASLGCFDICKQSFTNGAETRVTDGYVLAGKYRGVPISVGIGDNQASVLSTLTDEDSALLNVGTGSQISVLSDRAVIAEGIEARPYFENKYLLVGAALCGGRAYALLKDFYKKIYSYKESLSDGEVYSLMDQMAMVGEQTLSVDTRFSGTREDDSVRGGIFGISTENFTPEALLRGVLSGMVDELYTMYEKMEKRTHGLVGSGNGIRRNEQLIRCAEKRFGAKMQIPAHTEEAAVGAALYGAVCAGVYQSIAQAQKNIRFL